MDDQSAYPYKMSYHCMVADSLPERTPAPGRAGRRHRRGTRWHEAESYSTLVSTVILNGRELTLEGGVDSFSFFSSCWRPRRAVFSLSRSSESCVTRLSFRFDSPCSCCNPQSHKQPRATTGRARLPGPDHPSACRSA